MKSNYAMKQLTYSLLLALAFTLVCSPVYSQGGLLKKTKFKLNKKVLNDVFGEEEEQKSESSAPSNEPSVKNKPKNSNSSHRHSLAIKDAGVL